MYVYIYILFFKKRATYFMSYDFLHIMETLIF